MSTRENAGLAINPKTKEVAVFTVREPAWHKLGKTFDRDITVAEAIVASGQDYTVEKQPVFYEGTELTTRKFTVRTDTNTVLGVVGNKYEIVQPSEAYSAAQVLQDQGDIQCVAGGVLFEGQRTFLTVRLPEDILIAGEEYIPYLNALNSFDGSWANLFMISPIRTVCENTCNFAMREAVRKYAFKHMKNWERKMAEAKKVLALSKKYFKEFQDQANDLVIAKFTEAQFEKIVNSLLKVPGDDATNRAKTMFESERSKMFEAYNADDLNNIRDTKWGAYNAFVDYADHMRNSRGENAEARKFIRTFEDTAVKDRAFELIKVAK